MLKLGKNGNTYRQNLIIHVLIDINRDLDIGTIGQTGSFVAA